MERETEAARGEHPSVAHRQPNEMDRACTVEEKTTSSSSKVIPKRSVSEDAKGEVFLKLLLSVSTDRAKEKEYGDLSDAQRAEVDGRVLRVRNNIAMKALKVELKRLKRRRGGRKHHSTHLSGFTIHEQEEAGNVSRPPSSLPTSLGVEREEDLDRVATDKRSHEWKGGKQKSARLSIGTDEVVDVPACTPSTPGITPPLQTSQMKQSVQRVDSNASCWSSDSGYISDRGVPSVNGAMGRAALGDVAEDEEGSGLILDPGWLQGDHLVEKDGSETTPIVVTDKDDVFASSFKQALNHRVRVEEHVSTAYDEMGRVVGVFRERSIEESTVMPGMGCMDIQLNEEELSMASNDEEVRYLRELKCRYHAEFSNVMEFQELMKTLNRPPTLSDFLAFKLKFISDRYDTDYEAPINNAVSMIVSGSMDKVLSDSFFSSAVEPLLHQAKKAADLPFLMTLLGRRLVEVLPQADEPFQDYAVRLVKEMMADGVVDLVGRTMAHDFDEVLDMDDIIAVLTDGDTDVQYNPQEVSDLIQRHFSSAEDLTKLPGVPGQNRTTKITRKVHPSSSDDGPDPSQDLDSDSGTETPPTDPALLPDPAPVTAVLDELADHNAKSLGRSVMRTVPYVLMVALQNLT